MKKNFTKVVLASVAMAGLGLSYAVTGDGEWTPDPSAKEIETPELVSSWGIDNNLVPDDMINLGVRFEVSEYPEIAPGVVAEDAEIRMEAILLQLADEEDDVDPGFTMGTPVAEQVLMLNTEGGVISGYFFPEVMEVGKNYQIMLGNCYVDHESFGEMVFNANEYSSAPFQVYSTAIEIVPAFGCGEEMISLNNHSAVSVETAESLIVNFVNGADIKTAFYTIDMIEEDNAIPVEMGEFSINAIGYASFKEPLVFIAGYQYKLTIKAWDTTELTDENLNVVDPLVEAEFVFNGASATGIIGEPVFGIERGEFPEDMVMLGVPVRFPELVLPFGVAAEDCEITVSASLFEVQPDEETSMEVGVSGPICLAEAQLHNAGVSGGIVAAMLFPEMMQAGKHYAIMLNAVTVMDAEGEIVAEMPEDAYYAVDFDVIPYVAPIELGFAEFAIENNVVDVEDANIQGVKVTFPAANFGTDDATVSVMATLYDVTNMGELAGDDVDNMGVVGPMPVAQQLFVGGLNIESGLYEVALFAEQLEAGKTYVISIETITVENGEEVILQWDNVEEECATEPFEVISTALEVAPAFVCGEDQIALNDHSAVSVETAEALVVRFINGMDIKVATYTIDRVEEDNLVNVATGNLSINTIGYVAFDQALTFISGYQYQLTVKAWDVVETVDENLNVVAPIAEVVYTFNGASATGMIGEPVFGIERGQFEEDMVMLGVPVRFPELVLPFGVAAEDCEITVSASLFGVPQGNEPMPIALDDEDIDGGMGVDGPVAIAEAQLHNASVVGGVVTAMLFPEVMEVGNHYAIQLDAVTVIDAEGNIVAELPEDAYYAVDFDVVPAAPVYALGEPVWYLDGEEDNCSIAEDQAMLGVALTFPDAVLPENAICVANVMLYGIMPAGAEGGIMPLSAEDEEIDPGFNNVPSIVKVYDEPAQVTGYVEGGVLRFNLCAEDLAVGNYYVINVESIAVLVDDVEVLNVAEISSPVFTVVEAVVVEELEFEPAFIAGGEEFVLNSHSAVSLETADALRVNFINGLMVKCATYALDEYAYDEEAGEMVWINQLGGGDLSLNGFGYVEFDEPLTFVAGHQYVLKLKAWDVESYFDENWNFTEPIKVEEYIFNGAADVVVAGDVEFGIDRGEFSEDMINLGVPVRFPGLTLPFGLVPEECNILVGALLVEGGAEPIMPFALQGDDDIDPGMTMPEIKFFYADVVGGVLTAMLFPEQLEVGKTYTIYVLGLQIYDMNMEEMLGDVELDGAVTFTVVESENPVGISSIAAENGKVMFNLNGQKVNGAKGIVILNAKKVLVK